MGSHCLQCGIPHSFISQGQFGPQAVCLCDLVKGHVLCHYLDIPVWQDHKGSLGQVIQAVTFATWLDCILCLFKLEFSRSNLEFSRSNFEFSHCNLALRVPTSTFRIAISSFRVPPPPDFSRCNLAPRATRFLPSVFVMNTLLRWPIHAANGPSCYYI